MEAGLTPQQLAERLGKASKSIVYRLEAEDQEPDVQTVNALVAILHLSAEELLRAMGVNLAPPAATRLPQQLVRDLLAMTPEELDALALLVRRAVQVRHPEAAQGRR